MGDIFKSSKFWSVSGIMFAVIGAACSGVATLIQSKETDQKILNTIQETIEQGFKNVGVEAQINKI